MKLRSYLFEGFILFLSFTLGLNVFRAWTQLRLRGDVVAQEQDRLDQAIHKQEQLKRRLAQVQTREYQEYIAREKLNTGKEGEIVVLLPSIAPILLEGSAPTPPASSWRQWSEVFY